MFPNSLRAKRFAACSVLLKTYDVVLYIGTALAPVAGSEVSCPACRAKVSNFLFVILFVLLWVLLGLEDSLHNDVICFFVCFIPKRIFRRQEQIESCFLRWKTSRKKDECLV